MSQRKSEVVRILYVAAREADQNLLARFLRADHWQVVRAENVRSGRVWLAGAAIDIVISDMKLPDGYWHDLHAGSAMIPDCPPVVVAAEMIDVGQWADALSRGAFDVVMKPFDDEELLHVVCSAWLSRARNRQVPAGTNSRATRVGAHTPA